MCAPVAQFAGGAMLNGGIGLIEKRAERKRQDALFSQNKTAALRQLSLDNDQLNFRHQQEEMATSQQLFQETLDTNAAIARGDAIGAGTGMGGNYLEAISRNRRASLGRSTAAAALNSKWSSHQLTLNKKGAALRADNRINGVQRGKRVGFTDYAQVGANMIGSASKFL